MKRGSGWPIGIVAVLAVTVGANIWVMRVAGDDPSFAIEPDYYAHAVAWDSTMAQEARNRVLGWVVDAELRSFSPDVGAQLDVAVRDASGAPVQNAEVRVTAFAIARSALRVNVALRPSADRYAAIIPLHHGGAWELRLEVRRGHDRLSVTRRVDAPIAIASRNGP